MKGLYLGMVCDSLHGLSAIPCHKFQFPMEFAGFLSFVNAHKQIIMGIIWKILTRDWIHSDEQEICQ